MDRYTMIIKNVSHKKINLITALFAFGLFACQPNTLDKQPEIEDAESKFESAAYQRFREGKVRYEKYNEFNTTFSYTKLEGFEFEQGVERYYPSSVIAFNGKYYMWYSKPKAVDVVGPNDATDNTRAFHWDLSEIWYATSNDGYKWQEQGRAIERGNKGDYDHRSVFNPDILVANNKYYLVYQAATELADARWAKIFKTAGDFAPNVLGMSVADSPEGPWEKLDEPILIPGPQNAWDGEVVHEPTFFVKGGKYYLYYKSNARLPWTTNISLGEFNKQHADIPLATGVAIADNPEGPYIKSKFNPVLMGGHGSTFWPYRNGVCATMPEGPDRNSVLCAEDGINFYPMIQGLSVPWGGGAFRSGNYADVDKTPGQGLTWGVSHTVDPYYHFVRFEGDLSLEKGNKVRHQLQMIERYMNEEGYSYDKDLALSKNE